MNELGQLQSSLERIFRQELSEANFVNAEALKNLQKTNKEMDSISALPPSDSMAKVVAEYRRTQRLDTFRTLKYVCHGAAMRMQDGWCLLGDDRLRDELLADVEHLDESRWRLKCFEALLGSYFAFARYDEQTSEAAQAG